MSYTRIWQAVPPPPPPPRGLTHSSSASCHRRRRRHLEPGRCCSPCQRISFRLKKRGFTMRWQTWRAMCDRPYRRPRRRRRPAPARPSPPGSSSPQTAFSSPSTKAWHISPATSSTRILNPRVLSNSGAGQGTPDIACHVIRCILSWMASYNVARNTSPALSGSSSPRPACRAPPRRPPAQPSLPHPPSRPSKQGLTSVFSSSS